MASSKGLNKRTGRLKKGYKYSTGGTVVKAKPVTTTCSKAGSKLATKYSSSAGKTLGGKCKKQKAARVKKRK
jgi:hypothetical protein